MAFSARYSLLKKTNNLFYIKSELILIIEIYIFGVEISGKG